MTDSPEKSTELQAHYAAKVEADLERNTAEQQSVRAELEALQERLLALQRDQALLESMRTALAGPAPASSSEQPQEKAPRQTRKRKPGTNAKAPRPTTKKAATKPPAKESGRPTIGALIRGYLAAETEPRSAAEIATALTSAHSDRPVKATVVRTTVEGLVAKGHVERTKQGSSVFYSASAGPHGAAAAADAPTHDDVPS